MSTEHEPFVVEHVDHVEVFVRDQAQAAAWYEQVLGLCILPQSVQWASEGGPLMLSSDGGHTMLALFVGEPQGQHAVVGLRRVAFRVDAAGLSAPSIAWTGCPSTMSGGAA